MAYNLNKSPQPFGGRGKPSNDGSSAGQPSASSPFRPTSSSPLPTAPRMTTSSDSHAPSPTVMLRRQLLSPQSSPCPSPVSGRLRPHSIALAEGSGPQSSGKSSLLTKPSFHVEVPFKWFMIDSLYLLTRSFPRGHSDCQSWVYFYELGFSLSLSLCICLPCCVYQHKPKGIIVQTSNTSTLMAAN